MVELAETLAYMKDSGFVVAPAGYGKTHLIAASTGLCQSRQLILTHTHAGTNAMRSKLTGLNVPSRLYHVDTIASWCLRLALAYKGTSQWKIERPASYQWSDLYRTTKSLLGRPFVKRIVLASYAGLFVDEYQDCSVEQHRLMLRLAELLPTRIFGDPLQGIFDFEGQDPVDWKHDVESSYRCVGQLTEAERWNRAGAHRLGKWLSEIRRKLEQGKPIDLNSNRPPEVRLKLAGSGDNELTRCQGNTCRYQDVGQSETLIAIHCGTGEFKSKCHALAKNLSGNFASIEEIEGKAVFSFIRNIESSKRAGTKLKEAIKFAKRCMSGVSVNLSNATSRGENANVTPRTKNPTCTAAANHFLMAPSSDALAVFLTSLRSVDDVSLFRADLFHRVLAILRKHALKPEISLAEAAEEYQREFRFSGRPVGHRKQIGTTLLVKGLQYDHAVVLDAVSLSKKDLYVALTRGARTLTIVSTSSVLNPP